MIHFIRFHGDGVIVGQIPPSTLMEHGSMKTPYYDRQLRVIFICSNRSSAFLLCSTYGVSWTAEIQFQFMSSIFDAMLWVS